MRQQKRTFTREAIGGPRTRFAFKPFHRVFHLFVFAFSFDGTFLTALSLVILAANLKYQAATPCGAKVKLCKEWLMITLAKVVASIKYLVEYQRC